MTSTANSSTTLFERLATVNAAQRRQLWSDSLLEADLRWWSDTIYALLTAKDLVSFNKSQLEALCRDDKGRTPLGLDAVIVRHRHPFRPD